MQSGDGGRVVTLTPREKEEMFEFEIIIPSMHKEFPRAVLAAYAHFATGSGSSPPDYLYELAVYLDSWYLEGALARDSREEMLFKEAYQSYQTEEETKEFLDGLRDDYEHEWYADWWEEFERDIRAVLDFHRMTYVSEEKYWFSERGREAHFEHYNVPVVEVW